jgi:hypothetical protein
MLLHILIQTLTEAVHKTMLAWSGSYAGFAGVMLSCGWRDTVGWRSLLGGISNNLTASFQVPKLRLLRLSASDGGLTDPQKLISDSAPPELRRRTTLMQA